MIADDASTRNLLSQMDDLVGRLRAHIDELKDEIVQGDESGRPAVFDKIINSNIVTGDDDFPIRKGT